MKRISTLIAIFLAAALTLPWLSQAKAQNTFSFVSGAGSDANNCISPATTCRTFSGALGKTNDDGIITCVDAEFFGSVNITKSITIDCLAGGGGFHAQWLIVAKSEPSS